MSTEDACMTSPCKNGGECWIKDGQSVCQCQSGFMGDYCENAEDYDCTVSPCLNGGYCQLGTCLCQAGYVGKSCQEEDPCSAHPCRNNGTCTRFSQGDRGYVCACKPPYRGTHCEVSYDACASRVPPCLNGGQCYIKPEDIYSPLCTCLEGFTGSRCETIVVE
ncbi:delta-like protein C [Ruditapes philippinarum]|uniref:delta-like protein C n=1 Tax=Ruditapes philippinarum TaxID=129788 RepID=UPI00295AF1F2|nr:delta-like protein C [Ruditapes philippinarum]